MADGGWREWRATRDIHDANNHRLPSAISRHIEMKATASWNLFPPAARLIGTIRDPRVTESK
jgi:hypothetical protein